MQPVEFTHPVLRPEQVDSATPFTAFLQSFKANLENLFRLREDLDQLSASRGLPPYVLRDIMACSPLATFIPEEFGGRGGRLAEGVALVEAASYESLPLALVFGINWALFIQPVVKYGQAAVSGAVLRDFVENRKMGGLMITEPDYGSDALHMQSSWRFEDGSCRLRGVKHWAGLTGWADYWLLTARQQTVHKGLARDIDFFICDTNAPGQRVIVEEVYKNLGLYMIPYGRNAIDVVLPATHRLMPHSSGIKMMLDLLHRSRLQFPAMAMGFLTRILDEAACHCRERVVGGRTLRDYDQVQARLAKIQAAVTVCAAMCVNSCERAALDRDLAGDGLLANAIKTCITDLMQDAAQSLLQLAGAKGYRLDHFAGRAVVDSRPFQIFEGSNDILYVQIAEALMKQMKLAREQNLRRYLGTSDLTCRAADRLGKYLDFSLGTALAQRKLMALGQAVSRIVAMELVIGLGDRGGEPGLIMAALASLEEDIAMLLVNYASVNRGEFIEPERGRLCWRDYLEKPRPQ